MSVRRDRLNLSVVQGHASGGGFRAWSLNALPTARRSRSESCDFCFRVKATASGALALNRLAPG